MRRDKGWPSAGGLQRKCTGISHWRANDTSWAPWFLTKRIAKPRREVGREEDKQGEKKENKRKKGEKKAQRPMLRFLALQPATL